MVCINFGDGFQLLKDNYHFVVLCKNCDVSCFCGFKKSCLLRFTGNLYLGSGLVRVAASQDLGLGRAVVCRKSGLKHSLLESCQRRAIACLGSGPINLLVGSYQRKAAACLGLD